MGDASPTWLSPDNDGGGAAADGGGVDPLPPTAATTTAAPSGNGATSTTTDADLTADDPELPGVILTMRLANMSVAVAMVAVSIIMMTTLPKPSVFVLAVYATCGGLLICCLETQLKFLRVMIAVNFGFLFNSIWRFIFYLLLGSIAWSYETLPGQIVAAGFIAVAVYNTFVLCRYPSYRRIREKIAEEEDKRIEARISKEVRRQAIVQLSK